MSMGKHDSAMRLHKLVTLRHPLGHERRPAHSNGYTKSDTGPYPVQSRRPPASEAAAAHESQQ